MYFHGRSTRMAAKNEACTAFESELCDPDLIEEGMSIEYENMYIAKLPLKVWLHLQLFVFNLHFAKYCSEPTYIPTFSYLLSIILYMYA